MLGKRVLDELYLHESALEGLEASILESVGNARCALPADVVLRANVIKVNLRTRRVSFLDYPSFESSPFPILRAAWSVDATGRISYRSFERSTNPPILHRKELLVADDHPERTAWQSITAAAEEIGLFDDSVTIGFKLNWDRLIRSKGYELTGAEFVPIGNDVPQLDLISEVDGPIRRHLTALFRTSLSAPLQQLIRSGLIREGKTFFDFGCGRGGDVDALAADGFVANGWDPHFFPAGVLQQADVVNLGFVINVIEDPEERADALRGAFALTKGVLAVGVMLYGAVAPPGRQYGDGFLTSRNTFQKYFSQAEFKEYIEQILRQEVFLTAPGVAFVFADKDLEQRYCVNRYRRRALGERLLLSRRISWPRQPVVPHASAESPVRERVPRIAKDSADETLLERALPHLDALWKLALELGRMPEEDEVPFLSHLIEHIGGFRKAQRLLTAKYDLALLAASAAERSDDLLVYFAMQHFAKRPPYKSLERRLQLDIRAGFGDYKNALHSGMRLLTQAAEPAQIFEACRIASAHGVGWMNEDHALQLHASLVERLPPILRVYVNCGLQLYGALGEADLIKIHVRSGKLSLLEFDDFFGSPLPRMRRRIKVNLRELDYDVFDYQEPDYPPPILYRKSRYMHEEMDGFAQQLAFDEALERVITLDMREFGPSPEQLNAFLDAKRLAIEGFQLVPARTVPDLDAPCGANLTYRDLIECGETQKRLGVSNLPTNPASYNALYKLSAEILDPIIEYYGSIRLTYGFCSSALAHHIHARVAPTLDQHAAEERNRLGNVICSRGGAAVDFIVEDEDMFEVAEWIIANLPFDRLYVYGRSRPLHLSYSAEQSGQAFVMAATAMGRLMPRPFSKQNCKLALR